ncbi:hypothetical protein FQZ97_809390 [compost metagenome]
MHIVQPRTGQLHPQQVGVAQVRAVQVGIAQVGLHQRRTAQVDGEQVGATQVGAIEIAAGQVVAHMAAPVHQVDAGQLAALEAKAVHRRTTARPRLQCLAQFRLFRLVPSGIPPEVVLKGDVEHGGKPRDTGFSA